MQLFFYSLLIGMLVVWGLKGYYAFHLKRHYSSRDYGAALRTINRLIWLSTPFGAGRKYYDRALINAQLGNTDAALADFQKAIRRGPDDSQHSAYLGRASIYLQQHELETALDDCQRAMAFGPATFQAHILRARVHLALGDFQNALTDADEALAITASMLSDFTGNSGHLPTLALFGQLIEVFRFKALMYFRQNQPEKVLNTYHEALRLMPEEAILFYDLGKIHFARGQFDEAITNFSRARELVDWSFCHQAIGLTDQTLREYVAAGLDSSLYARELSDAALAAWQAPLKQDERYHDVDWVRTEFNWPEPLVDGAYNALTVLAPG